MNLAPGTRWTSSCCTTQVIVVRAPADDLRLECGGTAMLAEGEAATTDAGTGPAEGLRGGTEMGKRYVDDELGIEVLCTAAGEGTVAVNGKPLELAVAKPLPSSD